MDCDSFLSWQSTVALLGFYALVGWWLWLFWLMNEPDP